MRIDLSQLASAGAVVDLLPGSSRARRVALSEVSSLRGTLTVEPGAWQIADAACGRVGVEPSSLAFERVQIALESEGELHDLAGELGSREGAFALSLRARALRGTRLVLTLDGLRVLGELDAGDVKLELGGGRGVLQAAKVVLRAAELQNRELTLEAALLSAGELTVRWGEGAVEVAFTELAAGPMSLHVQGSKLRTEELRASGLVLHGADLRVRELRCAAVEVDAQLPSKPEARADAEPDEGQSADAERALQLFDYTLLDGLSGRLHSDVAVALHVPVLGQRRATHELRVRIDHGKINYRQLEQNLAALEDSLLDFSVRDDRLVLERGLPLIPTRGRGSPLLYWPLAGDDLALAQQHLVRLAVLPRVQRAGTRNSEPPQREPATTASSKGALRGLSFLAVDASLALQAPLEPLPSVLRSLSFARLALQGDVRHTPGEAAEPGALHGALEQVAAELVGLPLGQHALTAELTLGAVSSLQLAFLGLRLSEARFVLEQLSLADVAWLRRPLA